MNDYVIKELINDYIEGHITWHEIQDTVEYLVMKQDGKGKVLDKNIIHNRVQKENAILEKIENGIKEVK